MDCSTKEILCLEERIKSQAPDADVFVYAVPRQAKVGDTYEVRGMQFRIDRYAEFPGVPPAVVVYADGAPAGRRIRYKMHIEQGTGIKQLYFENLRAAPPSGSTTVQREYTGVTCTLVFKASIVS